MKIIVPTSGGKDSQLCLAMACDQVGSGNVLGVHQHTGFDHSLTYDHMEYMSDRYQVEIIHVKSTEFSDVPDVMISTMTVANRHARVCTDQLKLKPWFQWLAHQQNKDQLLIFLGVRMAESQDRKKRYQGLKNTDTYCMSDISTKAPASCKEIQVQLPIVDFSTPAVFETLRKRRDHINPLYSLGHKRVGCFPCALAGKATYRLAVRDPEGRRNIEQLQDAISIIKWAKPDSYFDHDLVKLLDNKEADPFGFEEDEQVTGCSWCNL